MHDSASLLCLSRQRRACARRNAETLKGSIAQRSSRPPDATPRRSARVPRRIVFRCACIDFLSAARHGDGGHRPRPALACAGLRFYRRPRAACGVPPPACAERDRGGRRVVRWLVVRSHLRHRAAEAHTGDGVPQRMGCTLSAPRPARSRGGGRASPRAWPFASTALWSPGRPEGRAGRCRVPHCCGHACAGGPLPTGLARVSARDPAGA
jgi:hypothetical protein